MAGVQGSAMAIAVSNAGALGSLPCAMLSPDAMRGELAAIRAGTDKPYNVNFFCHTPPQPERRARGRGAPRWRRTTPNTASTRRAFRRPGPQPLQRRRGRAAGRVPPPVVSFHFGLPSEALLAQVRGWGAKVLASATTVEEALWLEAHGADAVIAQGLEAGGHRGHFLSHDLTKQLGTFALLPQLVRAQ
jgi:nitronate monooxygenase